MTYMAYIHYGSSIFVSKCVGNRKITLGYIFSGNIDTSWIQLTKDRHRKLFRVKMLYTRFYLDKIKEKYLYLH